MFCHGANQDCRPCTGSLAWTLSCPVQLQSPSRSRENSSGFADGLLRTGYVSTPYHGTIARRIAQCGRTQVSWVSVWSTCRTGFAISFAPVPEKSRLISSSLNLLQSYLPLNTSLQAHQRHDLSAFSYGLIARP